MYTVCGCPSSWQSMLRYAPCPPPMVTSDEFHTFAQDQNLTHEEIEVVVEKCGLAMLTSPGYTGSTPKLATSDGDRPSLLTSPAYTGSTPKLAPSGGDRPSLGSCDATCIGIAVGASVIVAVLVFVGFLLYMVCKRLRNSRRHWTPQTSSTKRLYSTTSETGENFLSESSYNNPAYQTTVNGQDTCTYSMQVQSTNERDSGGVKSEDNEHVYTEIDGVNGTIQNIRTEADNDLAKSKQENDKPVDDSTVEADVKYPEDEANKPTVIQNDSEILSQ